MTKRISERAREAVGLQPGVRPLRGLEKICKLYGRMKCGGVVWVWNYYRNAAVQEYRMPVGSAEWEKSEKVKWSNAELSHGGHP